MSLAGELRRDPHDAANCNYKIVSEQSFRDERVLTCGIAGHGTFKFGNPFACAPCEIVRSRGRRGGNASTGLACAGDAQGEDNEA
jgi:hypothetical protein